jgi:hypothetical protein
VNCLIQHKSNRIFTPSESTNGVAHEIHFPLRCSSFLLWIQSDPRTPSLSEDSKLHILLRAQQTANWAPWCEDYPSKENCSDGDAMAHGIGYLAAIGFEPSKRAVVESVKDGRVYRSPYRNDTEDAFSRDQMLGFIASQLSGEKQWLSVKRKTLRSKKPL